MIGKIKKTTLNFSKLINALQIITTVPYILIICCSLAVGITLKLGVHNSFTTALTSLYLVPFAIFMFLSNAHIFFGFSALGIIISAFVLFNLIKTFKKGVLKKVRFYFSIILLSLFILPLIYLSNYKIDTGAKGTAKVFLIKDLNYFQRVSASLNRMSEKQDYKYEILGWKDNNTVIYKKFKNNYSSIYDIRTTLAPTFLQTKYYSVVEDNSSNYNDNTVLYVKSCDYKQCVKPYLTNNRMFERGKSTFLSPDGNKIAFIGHTFFTPDDIMILQIK